MFNEAKFREIFSPSSGNVNDYINGYVAHIYRKYVDPDGKNRNADLGEKKLRNTTN